MLARRAVEALAASSLAAGGVAGVLEEADRISGLRPSMAAIDGAVRIFLGFLERESAEAGTWAEAVERSRAAAIATMDSSRDRLVEVAAGLLARESPARVVTLSCSSTVAAILEAWRPPALLISEGRPGLEGRAMAGIHAGRSVPVTLCTDAALPGLVREGDLVIVGADAVEPDGGLINKVGTLPAAGAARDRGVPFYAACERFKFTARTGLALEEMDGGEVWDGPPPGVALRNPYFERTPGRLVTGYLTDEGVIRYAGGSWIRA